MLNKIIKNITKERSSLSNETIDSWKENIKVLELKKGTQLVKERNAHNRPVCRQGRLAPSRLINYFSVAKKCPCWAHTINKHH